MNIEDWKSQIKRGTLEFCVLAMIKQQPSYGYEMISTLEKYPILAAKENTIYPLLRRLMKEEYISSFWQESSEGCRRESTIPLPKRNGISFGHV
ncbi:PadR family transcriptional regulator [Allobaculum sp. Allo2]|uniref:PadR family transcriptional regulator n=1 Tax=Allobaculum sp. Allo2 TaxID=2853432 RepID=UPI001F6158DD|nr:PadR family transcriptional regulator [Allobaculum sp. Allo2]